VALEDRETGVFTGGCNIVDKYVDLPRRLLQYLSKERDKTMIRKTLRFTVELAVYVAISLMFWYAAMGGAL
jgi:hypothetical protein